VKYLTIPQLQAYAGGINLALVPTSELSSLMVTAEGMVDTYCQTEHQPRAWFQQSNWDPSTRRFYPNSSPSPITAVDEFKIQISTQAVTGNPFSATIPGSELVVNNTGGWMEAVSLQAILYGLAPVLINLGLNTVIARVQYHTGWILDSFGEVLAPISGTPGSYAATRALWWQSLPALNPSILPSQPPHPAPPTIYLNGVVQSSGFTIDYTNGIVAFTTPPAASAMVSADYAYQIPDPVRDATRMIAVDLLAERRANTVGLAGLQSLDLPGQTSATRRQPTYSGIAPYAARLLGRYRHVALG
jgi:hypothetical protein